MKMVTWQLNSLTTNDAYMRHDICVMTLVNSP